MLVYFKDAFRRTLPVMAGYLFLGAAYGISMQESGFGLFWSSLLSVTVYGGSMQFTLIPLLTRSFAPLTVALLSAMIQSRHLFYGISMLEPYSACKKGRFYLIFSLTDETYSLVVNGAPAGKDPEKWYLAVSALDHAYWILGSAAGALLGGWIPMELIKGIDFAMVALFTVILTEQLYGVAKDVRSGARRPDDAFFSPALGICASVLCLVLFGAGDFLPFSMLLITAGFVLRYMLQERRRDRE